MLTAHDVLQSRSGSGAVAEYQSAVAPIHYGSMTQSACYVLGIAAQLLNPASDHGMALKLRHRLTQRFSPATLASLRGYCDVHRLHPELLKIMQPEQTSAD